MALKVPNAGLQYILDTAVLPLIAGYALKLFKNNYTPVAGSVAGDFTECDFPGYSAGTAGYWTSSVIVSNHAVSTAAAVTFTRSTTGTPQLIYGYFVVNGSGLLVWAERDPAAPFTVTLAGDNYTVTPKFSLVSEF